MTLLVGRIDRLYEGAGGRWAVVSVRGARVEVAADLVPEAGVGDAVLIEAGVALARLRTEGERAPTEKAPCA